MVVEGGRCRNVALSSNLGQVMSQLLFIVLRNVDIVGLNKAWCIHSMSFVLFRICKILLACSGWLLVVVLVGVVIGVSTFQSLVLGSLIPPRMGASLCWIVMSSFVNMALHPLSQNSPIDKNFCQCFEMMVVDHR